MRTSLTSLSVETGIVASLVFVERTTSSFSFISGSSLARLGLVESLRTCNPNLDTDDTINSVSFSQGIIDVLRESHKAQRSFTIAFSTCDFSTVQTTTGGSLDTFSASAHNSLNSLLLDHTEGSTILDLISDITCDQCKV